MKALKSSRLGAIESTGSGAQVNRRAFLRAVGAGLVATKTKMGQAASIQIERSPDVVVVGAGAFGMWTALHLQGLGAQVRVVDAYGVGNSRQRTW